MALQLKFGHQVNGPDSRIYCSELSSIRLFDKVILYAHLLDLIELCFNPVDVILFVDEN